MKGNKLLSYWERKDKGGIYLLFLQLLSFIYLFGYSIRKMLYSIGIIKIRELPARVISVGNITLGGSGKTPFVLYLGKKLKERSLNFAVLTRGYRRRSRATKELRRIHSPETKWGEVGDEPFLLSNHLPEIAVIIDQDRFHSGKIATDKYKAEVLILDDGFQHWRLKRDLDIVMIDASIDLDEEKLLPAGRLREPLSALKRAGILILTRVDQSNNVNKLKKLLQEYNPKALILESILKATSILNWKDKTAISLDSLKGKKGIAFCGIGNPFSFKKTLSSLGIEILNAFFFLDHYIYSWKDLSSLREEGIKLGVDFLITTEKDSIRLPETKDLRTTLLVLNVELKITSGEEKLWEILKL